VDAALGRELATRLSQKDPNQADPADQLAILARQARRGTSTYHPGAMLARIPGVLVAMILAATVTACTQTAPGGPAGSPASAGTRLATAPTGRESPSPAGGRQSAGPSGIVGWTVVDKCPVMREPACEPSGFPGRFTVLTAGSGAVVTTVTAAMDGSFRVTLTPGVYQLRPERWGMGNGGGTVQVTVGSGRYASVTLLFESNLQ
jgi:hypothetical protein